MDAPDLALDSMEAEELELTRTPGSSPAWLTRTTSSSRFVAMETGGARVLVAADGVGPESEALAAEDIGPESEEVAAEDIVDPLLSMDDSDPMVLAADGMVPNSQKVVAEDVVDPLLSTDDSDPMVLAADGMVSDSHEPTHRHAKIVVSKKEKSSGCQGLNRGPPAATGRGALPTEL